jgi:hypothetical protein
MPFSLKVIDRSQPNVASNSEETPGSIRCDSLSQRLHRVGQWEQGPYHYGDDDHSPKKEIGEVAGPFPMSVTFA